MPTPSDPLTDRVRALFRIAEKRARIEDAVDIAPEHVLWAFAKYDEDLKGPVGRLILERCGLDLASHTDELLGKCEDSDPFGRIRAFNASATHAIAFAKEEADLRGDRHLGSEHLMLGLIRLRQPPISEFFESHGIEIGKARRALDEILSRDS